MLSNKVQRLATPLKRLTNDANDESDDAGKIHLPPSRFRGFGDKQALATRVARFCFD